MDNRSSPNYHNWYQIEVVLEKKGCIQTPNFSEGLFHFTREKDDREMVYEKSNKMSIDLTKILLKKMDINYEEFLTLAHQ